MAAIGIGQRTERVVFRWTTSFAYGAHVTQFSWVQNLIRFRTRIRSLALVIALLAVPLAARSWRYDVAYLGFGAAAGLGFGYVMLSMSSAVTRAVGRLARGGFRETRTGGPSEETSSLQSEALPVDGVPKADGMIASRSCVEPPPRTAAGLVIVLAWTCAATAGPILNIVSNRLLYVVPGATAEACLGFFLRTLVIVHTACALCLFWGLYALARPFLERSESVAYSLGLLGLHVVAFLLTTTIL